MATYNDFEKKAKTDGLYDSLGSADLALARKNPDAGMAILDAKNKYNAAPAGAEGDAVRGLARAEAESIRSQNGGYTTTADGREVAALSAGTPTYSGVLSENYKSSAGTTNKATSAGSLYKNYAAALEKERAKTMEDVLGKYAAQNGGYGTSAGMTAAASAGMDISKVLAEKQIELNKEDYNRQWQEDERDYNRGRDALTDARYESSVKEADAEKATENANSLKAEAQSIVQSALAANGGDLSNIPQSVLDATGWSADMLTAVAAIYRLQESNSAEVTENIAPAETGSTSTGTYTKVSTSNSSGSTGQNKNSTEEFFKKMQASGNPELYAEMYAKNIGITTVSGRKILLEAYKQWAKGDAASDESQADSAMVTNSFDDEGVIVPGIGKLSWSDLLDYVDKGAIIEKYDEEKNTYTYTRRNK